MDFLYAIKDGLKIFSHWELYVITICYICVNSFFDLFPKKKDFNYIRPEENIGEKRSIRTIIEALIQILATTSYIVILAPIILGISESADWFYPIELVAKNPYLIIIAICVFIILELLLSLIPFVGEHKTIHHLIYGGVAIIYILFDLEQRQSIKLDGATIIVPTNLELVGFILLCIISLWVSVFVSALLISKTYQKKQFNFIVPTIITVIGCFFPVFVYGAWIGNKLQ